MKENKMMEIIIMKEKILKRLLQIEKDYNVKIIYAVESGSRMWGFSSKNSDYDIRFIYINKIDYYLSVNKRKDYIEIMDRIEDLDFAGWDIKKTLSLLQKSNMSLYEWINSPIIYIDSDEMDKFKELAESLWSKKSLIYSYIHLANGNYQRYIKNHKNIKLKKYLYIFRTISACMYMEKYNKVPPITINELSKLIKEDNNYIFVLLEKIIESKKNGEELSLSQADDKANKWIEEKIEHYKNFAMNIKSKKVDFSLVDKFMLNIVLKELNFK